jgi:hypothetical protein
VLLAKGGTLDPKASSTYDIMGKRIDALLGTPNRTRSGATGLVGTGAKAHAITGRRRRPTAGHHRDDPGAIL